MIRAVGSLVRCHGSLVLFAAVAVALGGQVKVSQDASHLTIADSGHGIELRIGTDGRCIIDRLAVRGLDVLGKRGITSGIEVGGTWFTTLAGISSPVVRRAGGTVTISGIRFGGGGVDVEETWTFATKKDGLEWSIDRHYLTDGLLDDIACPNWSFASMSTWTGALLGTGGVAWCKLFDNPNASYGVHAGSATFWNASNDACLDIRSSRPEMAMRFTREPGGPFTLACEAAAAHLTPKQGHYLFFRDRQDVWKPIAVKAGEHVKVTYLLRGLSYAKEYSRGEFKGVDGKAVREIMNTIGRIGVIDDKIVGSNGWYSGYAVLHEPWFALMALAVADPAYTANLGRSLDYQRDYAVQPDGMVKSRWAYFSGDSTPGTYDERGFYECQWGRLMDTQPSYAINVAELFDLNGDLDWVRGQKSACEKAIGYLLKRDSNGNGLVEMAVDSRLQRKSSDWLDVICASFENALVNAQMYRALSLWSEIEGQLGDRATASSYAAAAAKLKANFNKPIDQGGFWDPKNKWYVYWREKDGSVYGNNLTLPVNFMAIGYGLCDQPARRKAILDQVEEKMTEQKLFCWPVNIYPFTPDETGNQPFPTYENGDIFLAWAEMGIRAYADYDPKVAVKYVENVLDRYNKDGLAFQRYLRGNQAGAGDDILANNCSAVIGLYRDIYGIQPKHNRLYLDPHVTAAQEGTMLRYWLRDRWYRISPGLAHSSVESGGWEVRAPGNFGVRFQRGSADFFAGDASSPSLSVSAAKPVTIWVASWGATKRWTVSGSATQTVHGLKPGVAYRVTVDGRRSMVVATGSGEAKVTGRSVSMATQS